MKNLLAILQNYYLINIIYSFLFFIILKLLYKILDKINYTYNEDEKKIYLSSRRNKTILRFLYAIIIIIIWKKEFSDIITFISFISAALTLAAKDIIYNYLCGIYIKVVKPIKIEDRIKVGDNLGDVINLGSLSFEMLEVNIQTNQSTGKIIYVPNCQIFNSTINNYTVAFKYIWDEITINIPFNEDLETIKNILLTIINNNNTIKDIPKKMAKEVKKASSEYRIYYNKLTPIIYTSISDNKIILTARFLIHPKKARIVESELYENIIAEFKKHNITI